MSIIHTRVGGWCWVCGGDREARDPTRRRAGRTPNNLAGRLQLAKLAGTTANQSGHHYHFRTNEMAANMALNIFAEWLRERNMFDLANQIIEGEQ